MDPKAVKKTSITSASRHPLLTTPEKRGDHSFSNRVKLPDRRENENGVNTVFL
jgi:hypothetical protein